MGIFNFMSRTSGIIPQEVVQSASTDDCEVTDIHYSVTRDLTDVEYYVTADTEEEALQKYLKNDSKLDGYTLGQMIKGLFK